MATGNINIDPAISMGIKTPDSMTSLGNMLNIARGAQAYQQAQQVNPLQVQAAQLELQKQQGMLQPSIRQAEAQAGTAELGLSQNQLNLAGGMLTGLEYSDAFKNNDIPELTNQVKTMETILKANNVPVEKTFGQLNEMLAKGDINGVKGFVGNLRNGLASASEKYQAGLPQLTTVGGQPATFTAGGARPGTISTAPINPATAPSPVNAGAVSNAGALTTVAPGVETAPVSAPAPLAGKPLAQTGVTPQQMAMPPEAAELSRPVPLAYPVRQSGTPYSQLPSEVKDTETNIAYRNRLTEHQLSLPTAKRNIQEVIASADKIEKNLNVMGVHFESAGVTGALARKYNEILGTETGIELKELNKNLANVAISNIRAQGGSMDTDSGRQLVRMANGDETYPPKILKDIARRTDAELTGIDLQAKAANVAARKFGDNNLNSFKQEWSKNADNKIFEAKNIFDSQASPKEKKDAIDRLLIGRVVTTDKPMTKAEEKQRKIFLQKYQNIQKLVENGSLGNQ
jgi:hypothetical protein